MEQQFELDSEYIELNKLLKLLRLVESGGQASLVVEEGMVFRNGTPEFRKRAKLRSGDRIEFEEHTVYIE